MFRTTSTIPRRRQQDDWHGLRAARGRSELESATGENSLADPRERRPSLAEGKPAEPRDGSTESKGGLPVGEFEPVANFGHDSMQRSLDPRMNLASPHPSSLDKSDPDDAVRASVSSRQPGALHALVQRWERPLLDLAARCVSSRDAEEVVTEPFMLVWPTTDRPDASAGNS